MNARVVPGEAAHEQGGIEALHILCDFAPVIRGFEAEKERHIRESIDLTENRVGALQEIGHPVSIVYVETNNLPDLLCPCSPEELVVFNWCDDLPGVPHSEALVAQELEQHGFTYTEADS